jgi:hypothetical protein
MNFSNFTKISLENLIYFKNEIPIENVGSIKFYTDNSSKLFLKKEFRWSFDRIYWSSWEDLNVGNIKVNTGDHKFLFFEIKYTMTSPTAGKVSAFSIEYLPNTSPTYAPPVEGVSAEHAFVISDGCNDLGGVVKTFEVTKITDAETLLGKNANYYLWRPNQKGEQAINTIAGLQKALNNLMGGLQTKQDISSGFTGTFLSDGSTVTVLNGLITGII